MTAAGNTRTGNSTEARGEITFRGRNQSDAKRKALNFWYSNQQRLKMSIRDFSERLKLLPDGCTIVFEPEPRSVRR